MWPRFCRKSVPKWLDALCKSLDVFTIWMLLLIAIGFAGSQSAKIEGQQVATSLPSAVWRCHRGREGAAWAFIFS